MEDMTVEDLTPETTMLTVLGPNSTVRLGQLVDEELADLPPYHTRSVTLGGESFSVINRPLAEIPAFELLLSTDSASAVWSALVESEITPIGLQAYQTLRVERAIPSHGREMGDTYNPLEAGLIGSIDFTKGCYIGQEVIARLDTYRKVQKHLVVLHFPEDTQVSEGDSLEHEGRNIGTVTSVAYIPTSGQLIGLGYVRTASASVGTRLNLAAPGSGEAGDRPVAPALRAGGRLIQGPALGAVRASVRVTGRISGHHLNLALGRRRHQRGKGRNPAAAARLPRLLAGPARQ